LVLEVLAVLALQLRVVQTDQIHNLHQLLLPVVEVALDQVLLDYLVVPVAVAVEALVQQAVLVTLHLDLHPKETTGEREQERGQIMVVAVVAVLVVQAVMEVVRLAVTAEPAQLIQLQVLP